MIKCPNCHHEEVEGALFCSECGRPLDTNSQFSTQNFGDNNSNQIGNIPTPPIPPNNAVQETYCALNIVEIGKIIPLENKEEFTLGRSAEGQPISPDIDLSFYRAYEYGVSRLHASLKVWKDQVSITDLGSVNGTMVNGKRISPHKSMILNHGDLLSLGKLKLQVLIRR
jgi:hypothetical protein